VSFPAHHLKPISKASAAAASGPGGDGRPHSRSGVPSNVDPKTLKRHSRFRPGKKMPRAPLTTDTPGLIPTMTTLAYFDLGRESVDRAVGTATEKVMRWDRRWFEQNPNRSYRARHFYSREAPTGALVAPPHGHARWTLVYQVEPGFRWRAFLSLPMGAAPADCDESIRVLFEKCGPNAGYHNFPIKHFRPTGKTWPNTGAGYAQ
jgi:hypothetical protein